MSSNIKLSSVSRWLLALLFMLAGVLHFVFPARYAEVIPPALPYPLMLVFISGACEFLGGLGVVIPSTRRFAGYGLIALLIAVFPANITMLTNQMAYGWSLATLLLILRLPLQFLMIWWVYRAACGNKGEGGKGGISNMKSET